MNHFWKDAWLYHLVEVLMLVLCVLEESFETTSVYRSNILYGYLRLMLDTGASLVRIPVRFLVCLGICDMSIIELARNRGLRRLDELGIRPDEESYLAQPTRARFTSLREELHKQREHSTRLEAQLNRTQARLRQAQADLLKQRRENTALEADLSVARDDNTTLRNELSDVRSLDDIEIKVPFLRELEASGSQEEFTIPLATEPGDVERLKNEPRILSCASPRQLEVEVSHNSAERHEAHIEREHYRRVCTALKHKVVKTRAQREELLSRLSAVRLGARKLDEQRLKTIRSLYVSMIILWRLAQLRGTHASEAAKARKSAIAQWKLVSDKKVKARRECIRLTAMNEDVQSQLAEETQRRKAEEANALQWHAEFYKSVKARDRAATKFKIYHQVALARYSDTTRKLLTGLLVLWRLLIILSEHLAEARNLAYALESSSYPARHLDAETSEDSTYQNDHVPAEDFSRLPREETIAVYTMLCRKYNQLQLEYRRFVEGCATTSISTHVTQPIPESEDLSGPFSELEATHAQLLVTFEKAISEFQEHKQKLQISEDRVHTSEIQLLESQEKIKTLETQLQDSQKKAAGFEGRLQTSLKGRRSTEDQLRASENLLSDTRAEVAKKKDELEKTAQLLRVSESEAQSSKDRLDKKQDELHVSEEQRQDLRRQLTGQADELHNIEHQLRSSEGQVRRAKEQLRITEQEAKEKVRLHEQEKQNHEDHMRIVTEKLLTSEQEMRSHLDRVRVLEELVLVHEAQIQEAQTYQTQILNLKQQLMKKDDVVCQYDAQVRDLKEQVRVTNTMVDHWTSQSQTLERDLQDVRSQYRTIEEKHFETRAQLQDLQKRHKGLEKYKEQVQKLNVRISELENRNRTVHARLLQATDELQRKDEDLSLVTKEQLRSLEQLQHRDEQLLRLKAKTRHLEEQLRDSQTQHLELKENHHRLEKQLVLSQVDLEQLSHAQRTVTLALATVCIGVRGNERARAKAASRGLACLTERVNRVRTTIEMLSALDQGSYRQYGMHQMASTFSGDAPLGLLSLPSTTSTPNIEAPSPILDAPSADIFSAIESFASARTPRTSRRGNNPRSSARSRSSEPRSRSHSPHRSAPHRRTHTSVPMPSLSAVLQVPSPYNLRAEVDVSTALPDDDVDVFRTTLREGLAITPMRPRPSMEALQGNPDKQFSFTAVSFSYQTPPHSSIAPLDTKQCTTQEASEDSPERDTSRSHPQERPLLLPAIPSASQLNT